jgi:hypothetical protein
MSAVDFDLNNKRRIGAFLLLKDKCSYHELERLHIRSCINNNNLPFIYFSSFFSHAKDVCSLSLSFLINEEISNSTGRDGVSHLLDQVIREKHYSNGIQVNGEGIRFCDFKLKLTLEETTDLLINRFDGLLGSHMLDFQVSFFSAFEFWITKLYDVYRDELSAEFEARRRKKYLKLLANYQACDEAGREKVLDDLIKLPGAYMSFPDKLNAVFKKVDQQRYRRDLTSDRALIDFLRQNRNTVHNGGVHIGRATELLHGGKCFRLETGKPAYNENYNDLIALVGELVDIYAEILRSIEGLLPTNYCEMQHDTVSLNWVSIAAEAFLQSCDSEADVHAEVALSCFADVGLSEPKARKLLEFLRELRAAPEKPFSILELLACDLG